MSSVPSSVRCVLSIVADPDGRDLMHAGPRAVSVAEAIVDLLVEHGLSATWAFRNPSGAGLFERLWSTGPRQEIAVLGDPSWLDDRIGRAELSRQLSRRILSARAAGWPIDTLVLAGARLTHNLDLLVKYGISVVRSSPADSRRGSALGRSWRRAWGGDCLPAAVRAVRFGVWEIGTSLVVPGDEGRLPLRSGAALVRRRLAAADSGLFHVSIQLGDLVESPVRGIGQVERILAEIAARSAERELQCETLAGLGRRLSRPRPARPALSILRRAA